MTLSKNYVELYSNYFNEIDEIKKSLKMFKIKKNNALKKAIFAPEREVLELEAQLKGETISINVDNNNEDSDYVEAQKKEISKDENMGDILNLLDDNKTDSMQDAKENDMVQIYRFTNGDIYIGRLLDGKMTGIGSYIFATDDQEKTINTEYIGNFINGIREGKGSFSFSNGNEYIGNFKNNKSNGIGRMIYANGDEYIGNWKDGKKDGLGIYTWKDGYIYIGDFVDSKMDGNGSCFNSKGELVFDGEWKLGQIHGKGKYIWNKNKWYEGEFFNGKKHGRGIFYLNNEPVYNGTWKEDKPFIFNKSIEDILAAMMQS